MTCAHFCQVNASAEETAWDTGIFTERKLPDLVLVHCGKTLARAGSQQVTPEWDLTIQRRGQRGGKLARHDAFGDKKRPARVLYQKGFALSARAMLTQQNRQESAQATNLKEGDNY